MSDPSASRLPLGADDELSLLAQVIVLLRWRWRIIALGLVGAALGITAGLLKTREYRSWATFLPQSSDIGSAPAGLALMASQLGVRIPTSQGAWGPPVYVALLQSRTLLGALASDTITVSEEGGRREAVMDLLEIQGRTPQERVDRAVIRLQSIVKVHELKSLNAVEVEASTPWPSVSLAMTNRLVSEVQRFNMDTRKSQAAAERQFVEARAEEAQAALREAEDRLLLFLQRNRSFVSPELTFEKDRLQREVNRRQDVLTTLLQSREDARIREVRDTPVITMLESPRLPVLGESRATLLKGGLGALAGGLIALLTAFLSEGLAGARSLSNSHAREFFKLVDQATPRFLRRKAM